MDLKIDKSSLVVFDLDDTLYREVDYLISAYKHIAVNIIKIGQDNLVDLMLDKYYEGNDVFGWLLEEFGSRVPALSKALLLNEYRDHIPQIQLDNSTTIFLAILKNNNIKRGLITDGRSITQRNKLASLGLADYFDDVVISEEFGSEKPDLRNFVFFEEKYPNMNFVYIGDNVNKDFIAPLRLGWQMICIKTNGKNIHNQDVNILPPNCILASDFNELQCKIIPKPLKNYIK